MFRVTTAEVVDSAKSGFLNVLHKSAEKLNTSVAKQQKYI